MGEVQKRNSFLSEFSAFLDFLRNLWALLASLSAFFPLSNVFLELIPLAAHEEDGAFDHLAPALVTAVSTVLTLFVVLWTFSSRHRYGSMTRQSMLRRAWIGFGTGLFALVAYLVIHQVYSEYAFDVWGWETGDPRKLVAEVPLLLLYSAFFALLTRAFMLLGMVEYFGQDGEAS